MTQERIAQLALDITRLEAMVLAMQQEQIETNKRLSGVIPHLVVDNLHVRRRLRIPWGADKYG